MAEDLSRPAFRYPSSGRRPERLNTSRGVNAPLQLLRGWAAGTLGLPGDIEGMVRMLPGIKDETPALPTSDFYREWLPGYDERPAARAISGLGAMAGGAGSTRVAGAGLGAVKRATDADAIRAYVRSAQGLSGMPGAAVVKPKGGNWLPGSVENVIEPLRTTRPEEASYIAFLRQQAEERGGYNAWLAEKLKQDPSYRGVSGFKAANEYLKETGQPPLFSLGPDAALNQWLDQKLAKYVRNEMATPEDPLRLQADAFAVKKAEMLAAKDAQLQKAVGDLERARAERGVTPEMLTQSQARIRELRKERANLEAQTGLHFTPEGGTGRAMAHRKTADAMVRTPALDSPGSRLGLSEMAQKWEDVSDAAAAPGTYATHAPFGQSAAEAFGEFAGKNPDAAAYAISGERGLGFRHLTDELRNALNPESGLPEALRIEPDKLAKMNVAQAAKLVDDINAYRAGVQAEVNAARAGNVATRTFKEYPEAGLKWVELKMPEGGDIPEGYQIVKGERGYFAKDPEGRVVRSTNFGGWAESEEAMANELRQLSSRSALEDALKYEGEVMDHCVGGYCPDVVEGRSRIFSLRDAEGRPYTTIEVIPPDPSDLERYLERYHESLSEAEMLADDPEFVDRLKRAGKYVPNSRWEYDMMGREHVVPEPPGSRIQQIKGPGNRAPAAEVLPYVQDFVKGGKWSEVGDLRNAGLVEYTPRVQHIPRGLTGVVPRFNESGIAPGYYTEDELAELMRNANPSGYAEGGLVRYNPDEISSLADQLREEMYG